MIINLKKKFKKIQSKIDDINGDYTSLSNMSDWNPAEMIGDKPDPLAISLYSELITDRIWRAESSLLFVRSYMLILVSESGKKIEFSTITAIAQKILDKIEAQLSSTT